MMDEEKRFRKFVGVLAAMIVLGAVFVVGTVVAEVDNWYTIVSAAILVSIAVVAVFVAWRRQEELKSGFPHEDERSRALKMRAGYLALWVSMYFCLALGWIIGAFVEDSTRKFLSVGEMMFVLVAAMGIFYLVILVALSRGKGTS
jgi:hydrogenase-4 membrane subunit HyfE